MQQTMAALDHPLLFALELATRAAELHRLAEGDILDCVQLAELTPFPCRKVRQQLAAETSVAGGVFPMPAAGAKVINEHALALQYEGLISESGKRRRLKDEGQNLNSPAQYGT
jgi:hypothetical protein